MSLAFASSLGILRECHFGVGLAKTIFTGRMQGIPALAAVLLILPTLCPGGTPTYPVGSIPPLEASLGSTLTVQLQPSDGTATFSYALDPGYPAPQGAISLDSSGGVFSYAPASGDKFQFRVTFTASTATQVAAVQSVLITPLPNVSPESDIIGVIPESTLVPDGASPDYLVVTQSQNAQPELFNTIQQTTWNVEISGKTVIFNQSDAGHGGLFTSFNNRPDMKNMSIYAETLIINSALKLPGTNVMVYARHLLFADQPGQAPASLDTTPQPWLVAPAQFQNGAFGQNGGNIQLVIGDLSSGPGSNAQLISNGGKAQDAGQGAAGGVATWAPPYGNPPYTSGWTANPPWYIRISGNAAGNELDWHFSTQSWGWVNALGGGRLQLPFPAVMYVTDPSGCGYGAGQQVWPQNRGGDAVPPGIPGTGGSGGAVSSSLQIDSSLIQVSGGLSGQPGSAQPGGPAEPPTAAWLTTTSGRNCTSDYFNFQVTALYTLPPGNAAQPVPPAQPTGADGSSTVITEPTPDAWLHPYWVRQVIAHLKDTYRAGNLQYASGVAQDYSNLLSAYQSSSGGVPSLTDPNLPADANLQLQQASDEIQTLNHRLANNMDYFGHEAGWVPLLSLQATMNAFQGEVDADVPLLYLSLYLQNKASQNLKDISAVQDGLSKLGDEATSTATDLDNILLGVPGIQLQAQQISLDLQNFQQSLQQREDQLQAEAQQNVADQQKVPFWKEALRTISAVAEVVPAFQPALGLIGGGLNLITNIDTSQPLSSIAHNAPDLSSLFTAKTWSDSEGAYKNFVDSAPFRSFADAGSFAKQWSATYKSNSTQLNQVLDELKQTQVPKDAISQELNRLEAQDSRFNDLTQQVRSLQTEKQAFDQKIAATMQTIASDNATINKDLLSESSLYQNLDATVAQFDHGMMTYVKDMDRRARERLLRYQYYMAKAFEYRFLQPYPGNLNIDNIVQQIQGVVGDNYPANLDGIKSVYLQGVRDIVNAGITQLTTQPPERSLPLSFTLTATELQQLNQSGLVAIDLGPRIAALPNEDNRHLENLSVQNVNVNGNCSGSPFCRVRVVIDHSGQSTETSNGHTYRFYFGNGLDDQPFSWGASYDLLSGTLSQETFSLPGLSLLQTFLTGDTTPSPGVTLFSLPGADGLMTITQAQQPANLNAQVTSLNFQATVDFYRNSSSQVGLAVQTAGGNQPYIEITQPDTTGRTDGLGGFQRSYNADTPITLTAEPVYGSQVFKDWVDGAGNVLGTSNSLSLNLASSMSVQAQYAPLSGALPVSLSSAGVNFGNQLIATTGSINAVILSNNSSSALNIGNITMVGSNASDFSIGSNCGNSIGAGASCTISLGFTPSTAGVRNASIFIPYNALGSPQTIALTGTGIAETDFDAGKPADVRLRGDFDGDGKLDLAVWRPGIGTWFISPSSNPAAPIVQQWGLAGDIPVPGDYDGDGKTDFAVWRPSTGTWYILTTAAVAQYPNPTIEKQWGLPGDVPVSGDFDGDGKLDFAVWRPANGTWYIIPSSNPAMPIVQQWGLQGDIPIPGDYDGDGKTDFAVWRPSEGMWYVLTAAAVAQYPNPTIEKQWGLPGDVPVSGDFDGDGKLDFAAWRPSNGTWYVIPSSNPALPIVQQWGTFGDVAVAGDYDGDGRTDLGIWRPSTGTWYVLSPTAVDQYPNPTIEQQWGQQDDIPAR